ncbi:MAG TPA: PAS domain S-box protein [Terriglobales bacterium]|nr:PAS domain S-box protein [Terriglobales bacterium]
MKPAPERQKPTPSDVITQELGQDVFSKLAEITSLLGNSANFEDFLQNLCLHTAQFCSFKRSFVALVSRGDCKICFGHDGESLRAMSVSFTGTVAKHIIDHRKPYIWTTGNEIQVSQDILRLFSPKELLIVPVIYQEQVIGMVGLLDSESDEPISPVSTRRAGLIADQIAVFMHAVQNLQQAEENRRRAEALVGMALELGSSISLPDLVQSFTVRAAALLGARGSALVLTHGATMECVVLESKASLGRSEMRELGPVFAQAIAETKNTFTVMTALEIFGERLQQKLQWHELTLARISGSGGELLGVLCLADCKRSVSQDDEQMLKALTGHASIALENSKLFSKIAQSNKQWSEIFDSLSDYIVVHDDDHRIMRVNLPLAEFLGARPAEMIGIHMRDLLAKGSPAGLQPCPFCLPTTGQDEFVHPILDRTFLVSTSRIHGALHEGLQTIHVLRDVTERRDAERRYRELFDNVQEGVFFCDALGRFVDVNDALVQMLGYSTREELIALDVPTLLYGSKEQYLDARKAAESDTKSTREVTLRRKSGALMSALESSMAVRNSHGEIVQYRGLLLDITDAKLLQVKFQRERDFNTQILSNTQSMIMVADTAGLISYANRRCFEAGQFDENSLVGHRMAEFIAERDRPDWEASFDAVLLGELVNNLELHLLRGDGSTGKFSANISPMHDEQGNVNSVVVVMTDITDLAVIQAKLMHTEKLAAVGQLVSGVAHEVNNPLTAIMGFADLMLENPKLPVPVHQDLRVIMHEAQRTKEIVQNLLSFARQSPPQKRSVSINEVVRRTIALRSYDFASHGVKVITRFEDGLPEIIGDSHQLQQVFLNILNNAYDALQETERRGRIEIETENVGDGFVRVTFRDNGPGVSSPDKIFDPFFTTKDVGKGTGLGLSICYGIVREHGGEIMCRPPKAGVPGAIFCVRLPVVPIDVLNSRGEAEGEFAQ